MKLMLVLVFIFTFSFSSVWATAPECDGQFSYKIEGVTPFERGFRPSVKTGSLESRMTALKTKWNQNIKLVNRVKMKADLGNGNRPIREQDFYVVSFDGLNPTQKQELMEDYLDAMAQNTVSFPLGSRAGHLYTRVGVKTLDNLMGVGVKDYRLPSDDRLETVLSLSSAEFENLRWYAHHASTNSARVIGGWNIDGTQEVIGKIDDNKCAVGGGHNCTSWMSLAPIGEDGSSLKSLVGADYFDMGRNPGWMTSFIHARTSKSRFPFVVYMSNKTMTELDELIQTGKVLDWDYYLH